MGQIIKKIRGDRVNIANEVLTALAERAIAEIADDTFMETGILGEVAGLRDKKLITMQGIRVDVGEKEIEIDISIAIAYGCNVNETARNIQAKIREKVEEVTGLHVAEVVVNVLGIGSVAAGNK